MPRRNFADDCRRVATPLYTIARVATPVTITRGNRVSDSRGTTRPRRRNSDLRLFRNSITVRYSAGTYVTPLQRFDLLGRQSSIANGRVSIDFTVVDISTTAPASPRAAHTNEVEFRRARPNRLCRFHRCCIPLRPTSPDLVCGVPERAESRATRTTFSDYM